MVAWVRYIPEVALPLDELSFQFSPVRRIVIIQLFEVLQV